ncbi:TetR/AcrR family transcriptional regulator [Aciduricibacillus chroicocephali]|uniref:TetR/AcrR family transcriptional regulator n=1 Tax=Aciduricibacillus chroicocephali TaxID=3054939 RepID=A0ABY9KWJ1_9BACI|nr:TetR/AcrR family transcriptional regulator [Bacillaceae bacterium 44XB]
MKEQKQNEIIKTSIRLFAEKGFYQTSVQDIVDACGMSKGAFYGYFSSKEALHIAIFKHYFKEMRSVIESINKEDVTPREKLRKQMAAPLKSIRGQKEFFVMYLREQSFSINKELREFMEAFQKDMIVWYEKSLLAIYGAEMRSCFGDLMLAAEGLRNSYLSAMLFLDSQIDIERFPDFLMNRLDELADAFRAGEKPIITSDLFDRSSDKDCTPREEAVHLLEEMKKRLEEKEVKDEGMIHVLNMLLIELTKEKYDPYYVQGMLANLKKLNQFDSQRAKIAKLLDIEIL